MSTPEIPLPVNLQERLISANLGSSMLFNFLMGIYSMTYGGTVYLYVSKKPTSANSRIVLTLISALYVLCFTDFVVTWYFLNWAVVTNGESRGSIFLATVGGTQWLFIVNNILFYSLFMIADGLLIWRCYHVWGRSIKSIIVPVFLYAAELGLFITETVLSGLLGPNASDAQAALGNNISSALVFISLGTTISTTFLIGYRVHTASRLNVLHTRQAFSYVVTMIVESAAGYTVVLLLWAIIIIIPSTSFIESPFSEADLYIQVVLAIVAAMAPTVLVARIAMKDTSVVASSHADSARISALDFYSSGETRNSQRERVTYGSSDYTEELKPSESGGELNDNSKEVAATGENGV